MSAILNAPKPRTVIAAALALLLLALVIHEIRMQGPAGREVFVFEGLQGPATPSPLRTDGPTPFQRFTDGERGRLAVLVTDADSAWLSLVHGLKTIGVPFRLTRDHREALQHRVVLVYPRIAGSVLGAAALRALARHPRTGGTLMASNVLGGGLQGVFGFDSVRPSRSHARLVLDSAHPFAAHLAEPEERDLALAGPSGEDTAMGTHSYLGAGHGVLAAYDDGTPAMVLREHEGGGRTLALGFDLGFLLQRAYGRRTEGISRHYANGFTPTLDVLLGIVKRVFRAGEPDAVTLGTVPEGRDLAAVFTHDIDYTRSMVNAVTFAEHERARGFAATHFIQTKYVKDWNDDVFFDDRNRRHVEHLAALGMELASHSVSHSLAFASFPVGSGEEVYPDYRPFVTDAHTTEGGTILGELRISRFLIESLASGVRVESFRPGHLENPRTLPQALEATGYAFSSSVTANVSLTHLPFRLNRGRGEGQETGVFEFPITIEDELAPPLAERTDDAIALARRIARHGGHFVVLIHPDVTAHKLAFQEAVAEAITGFAWIGSLSQLGHWWRARDALQVDWHREGALIRVSLAAREAVAGLTLEPPESATLVRHTARGVRTGARDGRLVLDLAAGLTTLEFAAPR